MIFDEVYVKYCKAFGLPCENYDTFCKKLKKEFSLDDCKPTINGKRVSCWKGVMLNPKYATKSEQTRLEEII